MTIDEKIEQAAREYSINPITQLDYILGASFVKSEMLADMQKMAEALEKIYKVECKQQSCSIAARAISRQALAEFNAKYKGKNG